MSKIILSSFVKNYFQDNYVEFIEEFHHFVMGNKSYYFGRNAKNNNSNLIYHVHFLPSKDDSNFTVWERNWKSNKDSYTRTSDNLIFYTKNNENTYLVITFI